MVYSNTSTFALCGVVNINTIGCVNVTVSISTLCGRSNKQCVSLPGSIPAVVKCKTRLAST